MKRLLSAIRDNQLGLLIGAATGLVWANAAHASYERFAHALHFLVNDVGMVFFFALAAKEIVEATLPGGALASPRRAAVPLLAAAGGMAGPALLYAWLAVSTGNEPLLRGWAIPCATDIAFSYLVARWIFGPKHPAIPFLLLLAIADDAMGLVLLAAFYPTGTVRPGEFLVLVIVAMWIASVLQKRKVRSFWPYVIGAGVVSWVAFFRGGLHPALALVPVIPFIPRERRDPGILAEEERHAHDPLNEFEHWWHTPVQLILFFFGLVNAGVSLSSVGPGTWFVMIGLIAGKPIGIMALSYGAIAARLGELRGIRVADMLVVGLAAAIGFTVALFFATAAFPDGDLLAETKMGALLSFASAPLAVVAAWVLGVGRFRRHRAGAGS
ncbi:MAG TPA: Na+/H+ antiporter NhaA [Vicinamibacterales bacterium]|nr:Na+/H+ antiporter NhaA [Vicinamibacterales bacterium]